MGAAWKASERAIAKLLGGERVPITGRQRGDVPDVRHDLYSIEVKHWVRGVGQRIEDAWRQAKAAQVNLNQLPIAIIHQDGRKYTDSFVLMRLGDFIQWYGDPMPKREE